MKARICYNSKCRTVLDFEAFKKINYSLSEENLTKLWETPHYEFYCCRCYGILMQSRIEHNNLSSFNCLCERPCYPKVWEIIP